MDKKKLGTAIGVVGVCGIVLLSHASSKSSLPTNFMSKHDIGIVSSQEAQSKKDEDQARISEHSSKEEKDGGKDTYNKQARPEPTPPKSETLAVDFSDLPDLSGEDSRKKENENTEAIKAFFQKLNAKNQEEQDKIKAKTSSTQESNDDQVVVALDRQDALAQENTKTEVEEKPVRQAEKSEEEKEEIRRLEEARKEEARKQEEARKKAAEKKAAEEKAAQEKAAEEKAAQEKAAQEKAAQEKAAQEDAESAKAGGENQADADKQEPAKNEEEAVKDDSSEEAQKEEAKDPENQEVVDQKPEGNQEAGDQGNTEAGQEEAEPAKQEEPVEDSSESQEQAGQDQEKPGDDQEKPGQETQDQPSEDESSQEEGEETPKDNPAFDDLPDLFDGKDDEGPSQGKPEMTISDLIFHGRIHWKDREFTYYAQDVLPGKGLNIPGRHVNKGGYVCDGDGYICLANNDLPMRTVVETPFGMGRIYDRGKAVNGNHFDVYIATDKIHRKK